MPKYVLKTIGSRRSDTNNRRPLERNLVNLSTLGIKWNTSLIKQMRTRDDMMDYDPNTIGSVNSAMMLGDDLYTREQLSLAGNNQFIAYYDQTYQMRRDFLRKFSMQAEIQYVIETIADEVVVLDDMHYFAYPNTKQMKNILKKETGKVIVDAINQAYKHVYHMYHFNESNGAWEYVKRFLVDGFLAFEIIYATDKNNKATDIIGFKYLDPTTLKPEIRTDEKGHEYKVWVQNSGDKQHERVLLDTNVIYISWAKMDSVDHFSYSERLIRSFNTLRTIENSRVIWNVQNAQKRIKIVVPIGSESEQIARTRLRELQARYKEDIVIDNLSGEITVNGNPKFSFAKTMVFPSRDGTQTEISEIGIEGHDMNSTEQLKWFWQRFLIETKLPKDRFNMLSDGTDVSAIPDNTTMTREEYRFSLFISRIRGMIQDMLLKPTWIQFCLKHPEFAGSEVFKNALGLTFVEENVFRLAKENANLSAGTSIISNLSQLQNADGTPVFSMRFLLQRYLSFTDDDWALNKKMKEEDEKEMLDKKAKEGAAQLGGEMGEFGGGMGGPEMGGGMELGGGGMEEPIAPEAPAPEMGGGMEEPMAPEAPAPETPTA